MLFERSIEEEVDVFEMGYLRSTCGLTLWNRVGNEEVRRRAQVEGQLSGRVDECVLRWFGLWACGENG